MPHGAPQMKGDSHTLGSVLVAYICPYDISLQLKMVGKQTDVRRVAQESEVARLLRLDTTPWYKKPNLRRLYLCLVPAVLGVEMTSGYDGSILNGLQAVGPWLACTCIPYKLRVHV